VVEDTIPEVCVRTSEPAYPVPEDKEISIPVGAVTVKSTLRVEPETVKVWVEESVPYVVVKAPARVAGATVIVGEEGATGVACVEAVAVLPPAELLARS
jgi:hypothetical protein